MDAPQLRGYFPRMSTLTERIRSQFAGPGGISLLMNIALPMIISQGAETIMMFVDRMFLSWVSKTHVAAALGGGITFFTTQTLFIGTIGYVNAIVAQYLGAKRQKQCGVAGAQGLLLALCSYPFAIALGLPFGMFLMSLSAGSAELHDLEFAYFRILILGSALVLLRVALGSFFTGIGRTRIVMMANLAAMLANIVANYLLIFGKFGLPRLEIVGAAFGTLIGSGCGLLILLVAYFNRHNRETYGTSQIIFVKRQFMRLLRFGLPAGLEFFLNLTAFALFIQLFHSLGEEAAAAVAITFSWDLVAFLPMTGINMAVMSLVGRYMGAREPEMAKRSAYSAIKVAGCFSILMTVLFVFFPETLVSVFARGENAGDFDDVIPLAASMLRIAALYTTSDSVCLVFSGALRGAGDTKWVMRVSITFHWVMTGIAAVLINVFDVGPIGVWLVFAGLIASLAVMLYTRFYRGHWQSIQVIDDDDPGFDPNLPGT